ncbi:hypothetical protein EYF80_035914 [Liparis tanakae]|uniref:Uncharacterized protein n=1 Tax=Liparis tanakae TaxID=230148 RepID=A0A4Z2GM22_9TELE|nr:hypothetical protein EYF80_035914 [Liparis tanakae]
MQAEEGSPSFISRSGKHKRARREAKKPCSANVYVGGEETLIQLKSKRGPTGMGHEEGWDITAGSGVHALHSVFSTSEYCARETEEEEEEEETVMLQLLMTDCHLH